MDILTPCAEEIRAAEGAPLEWRPPFPFGKAKARKSRDMIRGRRPERIFAAHGDRHHGDRMQKPARARRRV